MIRKYIHVLDNFIVGFTKCLRALLLKRMLKDDPHMQLTKFKSIFTWLRLKSYSCISLGSIIIIVQGMALHS